MKRVPPARRLLLRLRHGGLRWLWPALRERIAPARPSFWRQARAAALDGRGLEIGGPSRIFGRGGALPVYHWAESLDNVNFATDTAWESGLRDGGAFRFNTRKSPGRQWLREATALTRLPAGEYAFVATSHCLEHLANPLGALEEWGRVTRTGGHLLVIVPDPARTFDHRRPVTSLEHLRADRARRMSEDDSTHFTEVLALHDATLDPDAGDTAAFRARVEGNAQARCVHHHVFDEELLGAVLHEAGWHPLAVERFPSIHLGALARKEMP
jgi:SAM-dependent methyltransferase